MNNKKLNYIIMMLLRGGAIVVKFLFTIFLVHKGDLSLLGKYSLIVGLTMGLPAVLRLGMINSLSRDLIDEEVGHARENFSNYYFWIISIYLILITFVVALSFTNFNILTTQLMLTILGIVFFEHLLADAMILSANFRNLLLSNILSFLNAALTTFPLVIYYYLSPQLITLELLNTFWLAGVLATILILFYIKRSIIYFDLNGLRLGWFISKVRESFYIFLNDVLTLSTQIADRYIVALLFSMELTGVYAFFSSFIHAIYNLVNSSVIQSYRPTILSMYKNNNFVQAKHLLVKMLYESIAITFIIGLSIGFAMKFLVMYINKPLVNDYIYLYWLLLLGLIFRTLYSTTTLKLYSLSKDLIGLNLNFYFGTVSIILLTVFLKSYFGIYSIPIAIVISYLIAYLVGENKIKTIIKDFL